MGLYKRKDSPFWWMLLEGHGKESTRVRHDESRDKAIRDEQRALAEAIYRARMGDLARAAHKLPLTRTIRFDQHADWYAFHVLPQRRGAERERSSLAQLIAFFGADDLLTITTDRVREYMTHRLSMHVPKTKSLVRPSTVNREVDVLKAVMQAAVPRFFDQSPLKGLPRLRTVKPKKFILRAEDEAKLLATMTPADRAFFLTGLDSLMRLSNLIDLRRDEDKGDHFALIDSKTGPYVAIISRRVRQALDELPNVGPYYFPHRRVAKTARDRRGAIRLWLKRKCKDAGIKYGRGIGIIFHTATRATGATRMLQAGHDLRTVQEVGNWSDIRSIAGYLHTDRTRLRNAVESVSPDVSGKSATRRKQTGAKLL